MNRRSSTFRMILTAILLALGMVLPFLTMHIPTIGQAISPLHIPVFICGLTCGWGWGCALGVVLPLLRSVIFGMPPLVATGIPMAFELAAYGALCGVMYPLLRKALKQKQNLPALLVALIIAMVGGRLVGGAAKAVVMGLTGGSYGFNAFVTAYFVSTAIGAVIHIILVPVVVLALEKAKLSPQA